MVGPAAGRTLTATLEGPKGESLLDLRGVTKRFGHFYALNQVELDLRAGEVHALVGHNGSGKSTLVKVLAGFHEPESGSQAAVNGEPVKLGDSAAVKDAGLRFVHQDLGLVDHLDAVDNVMLGQRFPTARLGRIDWKTTRTVVRELFDRLDYDVPLDLPVGRMSPQQRTAVAIARALNGNESDARILVFDEPTAAMPAVAVSGLFEVIARLKASGIGVLYISHHLEEIFEISDRVSVLRGGVLVATRQTADITEPELIELMVGDIAHISRDDRPVDRDARPVMSVEHLTSATLHDVSLDVRPGEIVGIAGIGGSGREELAGAIFGANPREGRVVLNGVDIPTSDPAAAIKAGLGMLGADRARTGSLLGWPLAWNVTLPRLDRSLRGTFLSRRRETADASGWLQRLAVDPPDTQRSLNTLSGGNQQRVLLARWLRASPQVVILDEPTQGVDVGAISRIFTTIREFASEGTAFIICSSDSEELSLLCDRVLVLSRGKVVGDVSGTSLRRHLIDQMCLGQADQLAKEVSS